MLKQKGIIVLILLVIVLVIGYCVYRMKNNQVEGFQASSEPLPKESDHLHPGKYTIRVGSKYCKPVSGINQTNVIKCDEEARHTFFINNVHGEEDVLKTITINSNDDDSGGGFCAYDWPQGLNCNRENASLWEKYRVYSRGNNIYRLKSLRNFDNSDGHYCVYQESNPNDPNLPRIICGDGSNGTDFIIERVEDTTTQSGTTQSGTTQSGTTQSGTTQSGTTQSGTTQSGTTQSGTTQSGTTQSGTTHSGTTQSGTTQSGTTQSGTTQPGTTQTGTTQSGTTQSGTTQSGTTQSGEQTSSPAITSTSLPVTTSSAPTRQINRESLSIICSGVPIDGETDLARPLCGISEENNAPSACRINEAYQYCVPRDSENPSCHLFNGDKIERCPDYCELHVVGGNQAVCRDPDAGEIACSEYNHLSSSECPIGPEDNCRLVNNKCISKPGLIGCGDHNTYTDCVDDSNCYVKPENGGFRCKTIPTSNSDSNWDEYYGSFSRGGSIDPTQNLPGVHENLNLTHRLLTGQRADINRNLAAHQLVKNNYRKFRQITDDLSRNLRYKAN
jgi:hypothetical protein